MMGMEAWGETMCRSPSTTVNACAFSAVVSETENWSWMEAASFIV